MEAIYSSADFLLQGSRREFSGYAVLEAMACGAIPAISDIPSFRAMTCGGRYGVLFPPGDHEALARGVLAVPPGEIPARSVEVRARFERALSFPAMAARLEEVYRELGRAAPAG
jgi:glycosyltransferase involved in cell wall biosynthesis